ncbi:MAG: methyltransferase [Planctomycetaceae bacterium]
MMRVGKGGQRGLSGFIVIAMLIAGCSRSALPESRPSGLSTAPKSIADESAASSIGSPPAATPPLPGIVRWEAVPPLMHDVAIMETVFWEPADTHSLRTLIFSTPAIKGSHVLEIGTGSGLVSLCCLQAEAAHVVATDLNPKAIHNVRFNAANYDDDNRLDARRVPRRNPGAWSVIKPDERFDFIIANPPWENEKPKSVEEFALYDPDFLLLDSLVTGARDRLRPGGRMWLAYGCVRAIRRIEMLAQAERLQFIQLDERSLEELPEVFLPGMVLELTVPSTESELRAKQNSE